MTSQILCVSGQLLLSESGNMHLSRRSLELGIDFRSCLVNLLHLDGYSQAGTPSNHVPTERPPSRTCER